MKFLFDENLSPTHAARLRAAGFDAVAVVELGIAGASDPIVRSSAIMENRVLITLDGDFGNIIRYPVADTPGVIWLRIHPPVEIAIAEALDRVLRHLADQDLTGKLVIDQDKIRGRGQIA